MESAEPAPASLVLLTEAILTHQHLALLQPHASSTAAASSRTCHPVAEPSAGKARNKPPAEAAVDAKGKAGKAAGMAAGKAAGAVLVGGAETGVEVGAEAAAAEMAQVALRMLQLCPFNYQV